MNQGETKPEFPRRGSSNSSRSETPLKDVARRLEEQMLASGAMSPPPKQFHCNFIVHQSVFTTRAAAQVMLFLLLLLKTFSFSAVTFFSQVAFLASSPLPP